ILGALAGAGAAPARDRTRVRCSPSLAGRAPHDAQGSRAVAAAGSARGADEGSEKVGRPATSPGLLVEGPDETGGQHPVERVGAPTDVGRWLPWGQGPFIGDLYAQKDGAEDTHTHHGGVDIATH